MYKKLINGFGISKGSELNERMVAYAKQGALRGEYLGFPVMHQNYTMSKTGVTDWTGFPRSGKTEVLLSFLMKMSEWYGWKHLVYLPDVGDEKEVIADLIHKKTGKTFDKRYKNYISEQEIYREMPFILEHFLILTKKDLRAKMTPYQFWELAAEIKQEQGINTAVIDAWKDLNHKHNFGRDDLYLEDVLSYRNAMSERHNLHFHTIVHPTRTEKDSKGNSKPPTPYNIKGGTEWYNNGKNMITVHRPSGSQNEVEIYFNKIKPRSIGSVGMIKLIFDTRNSAFFYINDDGKRLYSNQKYSKPTVQEKIVFSEPGSIDNIDVENDDEIPF